MNDVIIIYGPTAVGKSKIGVEIAKKLNGEIISADSMQIYKNLDIGTAKVTNKEMQEIKHHLIDIKEPTEDYSVAEFTKSSTLLIRDILNRSKLPIIVGGTGLYIKSLISGYDFAKTNKNEQLRTELEDKSVDELANILHNLNPSFKFDRQNKQRIIRYIEVAESGNKPQKSQISDYNFHLFCLNADREILYNRINNRVDQMIEEGILTEVKYLHSLNLSDTATANKAIGYKEFYPYIKNEMTLDECKEVLKQKTRNYAKRQITFFNQFENKTIVKVTNITDTANIIKDIFINQIQY